MKVDIGYDVLSSRQQHQNLLFRRRGNPRQLFQLLKKSTMCFSFLHLLHIPTPIAVPIEARRPAQRIKIRELAVECSLYWMGQAKPSKVNPLKIIESQIS